jgi:hypothetical protein
MLQLFFVSIVVDQLLSILAKRISLCSFIAMRVSMIAGHALDHASFASWERCLVSSALPDLSLSATLVLLVAGAFSGTSNGAVTRRCPSYGSVTGLIILFAFVSEVLGWLIRRYDFWRGEFRKRFFVVRDGDG